MGISGCGAGAVPSKQAKQTSKGLVSDAVWVPWSCAGAKRISKVKVLGFCAVRVLSKGAKQGCGAIQTKVKCLALG